MSQLELVGVPADGKHLNLGQVDRLDTSRLNVFDTEHLPGDGVGVFETGIADLAGLATQGTGDLPDGGQRWKTPLLDREVNVGSLSARKIERLLATRKSSSNFLMIPPTPGRSPVR